MKWWVWIGLIAVLCLFCSYAGYDTGKRAALVTPAATVSPTPLPGATPTPIIRQQVMDSEVTCYWVSGSTAAPTCLRVLR